MINRFVKFRFVRVVPLDHYHRYSVMLPTIETVDGMPTLVDIEICSISFN